MPAEPAAAPVATGANQPNGSNGALGAPHREAIGDRMPGSELLDQLEGLPEEVREAVRENSRTSPPAPPAEEPAGETPAPAPEAGALPSGEAGEDDPAAAGHDDWPESARERVAKLTKRREGLKEENTGLATQLEAERNARLEAERKLSEAGQPGQPQQQRPAGESPAGARESRALPGGELLPATVAKLKTPEELQGRAQIARQVLRWAKLNREGAFGVDMGQNEKGEQVTKDYTAKEIAQMEVDAEEELNVYLPARSQQLQQSQQAEEFRRKVEEQRPFFEGLVAEEYPDLADEEASRESPLAQGVEKVMEAFPFLKNMPDGRLTAADIVSANLKRHAKLVARNPQPPAAAPAPTATPPNPAIAAFLAPKPIRAPAVPKAGSGTPPTPPADAEADAAREKYLQTGAQEDYERWFELSKPRTAVAA